MEEILLQIENVNPLGCKAWAKPRRCVYMHTYMYIISYHIIGYHIICTYIYIICRMYLETERERERERARAPIDPIFFTHLTLIAAISRNMQWDLLRICCILWKWLPKKHWQRNILKKWIFMGIEQKTYNFGFYNNFSRSAGVYGEYPPVASRR